MGKKIEVNTGDKYNQLTIIKEIEPHRYKNKPVRVFLCKCDCGNITEVELKSLKNGTTKSCGCLKIKINKTHFNDLTGKKFGKLTVIKKTDKRTTRGNVIWECLCDCGNVYYTYGVPLLKGVIKGCGCGKKNINTKDLTGQKYNRLTVIEQTDKRAINGNVIWKCLCDCGNYCFVDSGNIQRGNVKSCGCLQIEHNKQSGKYFKPFLEERITLQTHVGRLKSKTIPQNNTSGVKGISYNKKSKKFRVQIGFKKKHYYLGEYTSLEEATRIRKDAEKHLFGEFLDWYENEYKKNKNGN